MQVTSTPKLSLDAHPGARPIRHVVVLGANGTMGFGSAALFTTAVEKVTFLARSRQKAQTGLAAAIKMVRSGTVATKAEVGSYDEDFEAAVSDADLIFEAVTEKLELKHQFFERIDACRKADSIVATVTSGLSINQLAEPRSESFRKHFMGLHFFNPPNVIVGTELVCGKDTDPDLAAFVESYCENFLGRVMIRTADTPGFAGNRVGFKVLNECCILAEEHGPLLVDEVVGPYTGRALPPLRTVDLVGWDIHQAIVENIHANAPDEVHDTLKLPAYMAELMEKGTFGNKSGKGFFMKDGKRLLVLDPKSGSYTPVDEVTRPELGFIDDITRLQRVGLYAEAMQRFVAAEGDAAAIAKKVIAGYIAYSFERVGEVTETITGIDHIMGFGFNWAPPSVLVDTLGGDAAVKLIEGAGLAVPQQLTAALDAAKGAPLFDITTTDIGRFWVAA